MPATECQARHGTSPPAVMLPHLPAPTAATTTAATSMGGLGAGTDHHNAIVVLFVAVHVRMHIKNSYKQHHNSVTVGAELANVWHNRCCHWRLQAGWYHNTTAATNIATTALPGSRLGWGCATPVDVTLLRCRARLNQLLDTTIALHPKKASTPQ